jgi:uncharacterized protein (DUF433 family)
MSENGMGSPVARLLAKETLTQGMPLYSFGDGAIRIGETRVLLDLVVYAFNEGKTPEQITRSFPSLDIADVYTVIGFYLRNREEIDDYIRQRDKASEALRHEIESTPAYQAWRQRILERQAARQKV